MVSGAQRAFPFKFQDLLDITYRSYGVNFDERIVLNNIMLDFFIYYKLKVELL